MKQEKPTFHDIGMLPMITMLIRGTLENTQDQYQTLTEAREKPHVLDDETVDRVIRLYTAQAEDVGIYTEQLRQWLADVRITPYERQEVMRLVKEVSELHELGEKILALADELKQGTIDRILEMDEAELALEVLSGKRKLPF